MKFIKKITHNISFKKYTYFIIGMLMLMSFTIKSDNDNNFETVKNLDIFYSIYKETDLYYVDEVVPGEIIKKGIDAMLSTLDPYTVYIPESKTEDLKIMTTGQYGGIGAMIRTKGDYTMISQPYADSPAAKAGLFNGDLILEIDGKSIKGKSSEDVSELLRGEPKTILNVKIQRIGTEKPMNFSIEREEIKMKSVPYFTMLDKTTGYIFLNEFTFSAGKEVKEAFETLKKTNNVKVVVLDLRGNPGGLLQEAVKICNFFIDKGNTVVSMKGKAPQMTKTYKTEIEPIDNQVKIIVLVNRGSASASEIVSGCMQDLDRGIIIGQRTFGKGLVQTTRELPYNSILKVTTAKYYTPTERCIQVLDYSHRNEDGSVGNVPDSLKSEYKTKNGRKVYDGGGIEPDIKVEEREISNISANLIIQDIISDYSAYFRSKHQSIDPPDKFKLSEIDYIDFLAFTKSKNFEYKSNSEQILQELIENTKEEKYYQETEKELNELQKKISHNIEKDLQNFKSEIIELIEAEIIANYYYNAGVLIYSLKNDDFVKKAIEVANNENLYNDILKPQKK
ncbi:MAG: S41 family peptidase [Bacteroidales bacterium]|jgi:carboxyl-terminal processing protease|nr:S41 family peptidase [Bacteroidales bacterium]